MVHSKTSGGTVRLVLTPNRSMTWQFNKLIFLAMSFWSTLIGVFFWMLGAWPILPFVGLELLGLSLGLWYSYRKLMCREVISLTGNRVEFEAGYEFPREQVIFDRARIRAHVVMAGHPEQAPEIELFDGSGSSLRIGAFLSKNDCEQLITQLRRSGLPLYTASGHSSVRF